jgi:hypothetical protein
MSFDPQSYGDAVAAILRLDGDGGRLMPLVSPRSGSADARRLIREAGAHQIFPRSRAPEAALAGLYLYFDCWTEAHETAQDIATPEGSYWHAIVHRQEPDAWNSAYWFGQTGAHPIFAPLRDAAAAIGLDVGPRWNPPAFIEICARAHRSPGSELARQACEVQRAEWQLLFDYCARP